MEIHFYERDLNVPADKPYYKCWYETKKGIKNKVPYIITTQMGLLSTRLIEAGYRVFVHPADEEQYEIRIGQNTCTDREICLSHNLFKMWEAGAFSANAYRPVNVYGETTCYDEGMVVCEYYCFGYSDSDGNITWYDGYKPPEEDEYHSTAIMPCDNVKDLKEILDNIPKGEYELKDVPNGLF